MRPLDDERRIDVWIIAMCDAAAALAEHTDATSWRVSAQNLPFLGRNRRCDGQRGRLRSEVLSSHAIVKLTDEWRTAARRRLRVNTVN